MQIFKQFEPIILATYTQNEILVCVLAQIVLLVKLYIHYYMYIQILNGQNIIPKAKNWRAFRAFDMECQLNYILKCG